MPINKCLKIVLEANFMALNVLDMKFFNIILVHNELEETIKRIIEEMKLIYL
jgi:hypothetical protein